MKILLVTDSYPPEIRSASHLMKELAEHLHRRGHEVCVLTCRPRYNLSENASPDDWPCVCDEGGVGLIRVRTPPHHKVNFFVRGIAQLVMPGMFLRAARKHLQWRPEGVIVYSPPLPLAGVGARIKRMHGAKFLLNVQDIFPQNAIDLGIVRSRLLIRFFEQMEAAAYENADEILVHSEGNRDLICGDKRVDAAKVSVVHNWVDPSEYDQAANTGRFRAQFGLEGKFVIVFAGVMGPSQGLEMIIEAAELLQDLDDVRLLLMGDGTEKARLVEMADSKGLENVVFGPFVSGREYPSLLAEADAGLVTLTDKNKTPVVPGKILGYMAAGLPVLAFLQSQSDGHKLIAYADCGYSAVYGGSGAAAEVIRQAYIQRDEFIALGANGRNYVEQMLCVDKAVDEIERLLGCGQAAGGETTKVEGTVEERAAVR